MTITIDDMKSKLLTADDVMETLGRFEPFDTQELTKNSRVSFKVDPQWSLNIDTLADTDPVDAWVTVDGEESQLSKDALNQLSVGVGLPSATVKKAPYDAVQGFLNRLYQNPNKDLKLMKVDDVALGVAPATITPFSSYQMAESIIDKLHDRYGSDAEIYADYKIQSTLTRTDVRFIIPAERRTMRNTGMTDVPDGEYDDWAAGLHMSNSLIGKSSTYVDAYLFRWWCTNGATTQNSAVGTWDRRRKDNEPEHVYEWAQQAVDAALEGVEDRFDQVQSLASLTIQDASAAVGEVFSQHNLPARQQSEIMDLFIGQRELTMYTLMQSITQVANTPGMPAKDVERLLRIGGIISGDATLDSQKARIWEAGHTARPGSPNPFTLGRR